MGSSDHLDVDPSGVRSAGTGMSTAPVTAVRGQITVTACAGDAASVGVANALTESIGELLASTTVANHNAAVAAGLLSANAATYEMQEEANAAALTPGMAGRGIPVAAADTPQMTNPVALPPPVTAVGIAPISGRDIATLIHGGPGATGLISAASALAVHADDLERAAQSVRTARATSRQTWDSEAAEVADQHLGALEESYFAQAGRARALSGDAHRQAQNFHRAKGQIPAPAVFDEFERRLRAANAANATAGSRGMYSGVITALQTQLAATHKRAVDNYGRYTAAAALQAGSFAPAAESMTGTATKAPTDTSHAPVSGDPTVPDSDFDAAKPPADPVEGLAGRRDPRGTPGAPEELLQMVLPAVLGGVAGAAGGLLGALSGVGDKLQQSGSQLLGGLAQGAQQAIAAAQGLDATHQGAPGFDPTAAGDGLDGSSVAGGGGAGGPGDTEPASSAAGPLSAAPASAAAAPATAPATFSSSVPLPSSSPTLGGGMPMGMMPPMLGSPRSAGGSGDEDQRLYPPKRLRLEVAPNTEPVKGRREARETRSDRGE
jgi:hypothetical protein